MAKIHVLESDNNGNYRVVIHTPMPASSNAVGNLHKDVWVAAGQNVSILPEGSGLGQITTAELADVVAGDVIELVGRIPVESGGASMASLTALADSIIADRLGQLAQIYKYYGHTQANGA